MNASSLPHALGVDSQGIIASLWGGGNPCLTLKENLRLRSDVSMLPLSVWLSGTVRPRKGGRSMQASS